MGSVWQYHGTLSQWIKSSTRELAWHALSSEGLGPVDSPSLAQPWLSASAAGACHAPERTQQARLPWGCTDPAPPGRCGCGRTAPDSPLVVAWLLLTTWQQGYTGGIVL